MELIEQMSINQHGQLDGVVSGAEATALFGGSVPADNGTRETHEALRNFGKRPDAYLWAMHHLKERTGLDFDDRSGEFHKEVVKYYNRNAPSGGTGVFAVNSGIPAGGQLKALVDLPLTDTSLSYINKMFIGNEILTKSPVVYQTGLIGQYGNEHNVEYNKRELRADGRANVRQIYPYSTSFLNYAVATYALMDTLSENDYRNYMLPFDAEQDLTIALRLLLMLTCEIDIANAITAVAGYPASSVITPTANNKYDKRVAGTLTENARALRASIIGACGYAPNTMVMDENVFDAVSRHPDVLGTIFQDMTTSRTASEAEVAKVFKVDRLLIGKTAKTASADRDATLSRVWGKDIWYGYVAPNRGLRQKTFGYYHHYNNSESYVITRQSIGNPVNRDVFCYQSWQHHIIDRKCGGLIKGAIA